MERRENKSFPGPLRKRCDRFILVLIAVQSTRLPLYTISPEKFSSCEGIRTLQLNEFDFEDHPFAITPALKEGLSRLHRLDLIDCRGELGLFIEDTQIPNLKSIRLYSRYTNDDVD
jgi:hypothetical protein